MSVLVVLKLVPHLQDVANALLCGPMCHDTELVEHAEQLREVTVIWDSATFSADARHDALRETIRERVVRVELDLPRAAEHVQARVSLAHFGCVQLCSVEAMPTTVTRLQREADTDNGEPALFLTLQVSGTSMMVQHGRHATLQQGQFAVYATTRPYTLLFEDGVRNHFFRFPLRELALPDAAIEDMSARAFGHDSNSVAALTSEYLTRLTTAPESGADNDLLAAPTIELVRAVLVSAAGKDELARACAVSSLETRILEYVHGHLGDPLLSATTIAAAHHISVRHLYTVLERAGISLGDRIRNARLERCRSELAHPSRPNPTIAAVAAKWGFADATHFARVFREAYGLSPREWRSLKLAGHPSA